MQMLKVSFLCIKILWSRLIEFMLLVMELEIIEIIIALHNDFL